MPFCGYCGAEQSATAKFCRKCGKRMQDTDGREVVTKPGLNKTEIDQGVVKRGLTISFSRKAVVAAVIVIGVGLSVNFYMNSSNSSSIVEPIKAKTVINETSAMFNNSNPSLNSKCEIKSHECFFSLNGVLRDAPNKFQPNWLSIDFVGDGREYKFTIDPPESPKRDGEWPQIKVYNSDNRLLFRKNFVPSKNYHSNLALPLIIKRPGRKEKDLLIISTAGNHSYFSGMEIIGFVSGKIQSLLISFPEDIEWKDNDSKVRGGRSIEQASDGKIFLEYRRSINDWNGPGKSESNRPSKEYVREIMWNSSESMYKLGKETAR